MAGVNYISGFQVGDVYYSGAEYGGHAVIIPGALGNLIATTENSSNMSWGAATLASGADAIPS